GRARPRGLDTELAIQDVWPEFAPGDVIVDAGGGSAEDGRRRAASLASARIRFVDCRVGDNELFVGGDADAIRLIARYLDCLGAWTHCGPAGTGYHGGEGEGG